jgi:preprotein translocase subunit SecF
MEFFKQRKVYDFMRMRTFWILFSVALTLGSLVLLF